MTVEIKSVVKTIEAYHMYVDKSCLEDRTAANQELSSQANVLKSLIGNFKFVDTDENIQQVSEVLKDNSII